MKRCSNILMLVLFGLALLSCESDLKKVHYDEASSQPAILFPIEASYVLDALQADAPAITFTWQKPQINYPASVTTGLQIDVVGNHFEDARTLASTKTDNAYALSTADLNSVVNQLLEVNGLSTDALSVEFRLVSTLSASQAPLYSNVVSTLVTPYAE